MLSLFFNKYKAKGQVVRVVSPPIEKRERKKQKSLIKSEHVCVQDVWTHCV